MDTHEIITTDDLDDRSYSNKIFDMPADKQVNHYIELTRLYRIRIISPPALPIGGWKMWDSALRQEFPIRYFLLKKIPEIVSDWYNALWYRPTHDLYWKLAHRFHPHHQYNILKPKTLGPGYYDPTTRILHACMEELRTFFEHGAPNIEWNSDEGHSEAYDTMKEVYDWWVNIYPHREEILNEQHPLPDCSMEDIIEGEAGSEWDRVADIHSATEGQWYEDDQRMLHKVIDVRPYMWFP